MVSGLHQKFIFSLSTIKCDNDEEFEIRLLSIKLNSYFGKTFYILKSYSSKVRHSLSQYQRKSYNFQHPNLLRIICSQMRRLFENWNPTFQKLKLTIFEYTLEFS